MIVANHYSEGLKERKDYELEDILEGLVDRHGIDAVTGMLGGVCEGKAIQSEKVWRETKEAVWWAEKASGLWNL